MTISSATREIRVSMFRLLLLTDPPNSNRSDFETGPE
jgi:hypothetical protein